MRIRAFTKACSPSHWSALPRPWSAFRPRRPDEIGDLCAYLSSDKAGYITGATININGGLHMC